MKSLIQEQIKPRPVGLEEKFDPELIVEVTSVCDRSCDGCYAQNIFAKKTPREMYQKYPTLFLTPEALRKVWDDLPLFPRLVSMRGGEPTQHPDLHRLIEVVHQCGAKKIVIETHGRWLIEKESTDLLEALKKFNGIVKISFDSMHELSHEDLKLMTEALDARKIDYLIAVTEVDRASFEDVREGCRWIPDDRFIFQLKAVDESLLPQPLVGVVGCDGRFKKSLNVKNSFRTANESH